MKTKIKIGVAGALLMASCVAVAAESSVVDAETAISNFKKTGNPCSRSVQAFVKFQDTFFANTCRSLGGQPQLVNEFGLGCKTPDGGGIVFDMMPVVEPEENVIDMNLQMRMKLTAQFTNESAFSMMSVIKSPGGGILECIE